MKKGVFLFLGISAFLLFNICFVNAINVYYSVGTNNSNLISNAISVTINGGTATFSSPLPNRIGVGDQVNYSTNNIAYISNRMSSTVYGVVLANGNIPADITGATVNSVKRAFNSLSDALDAADGGVCISDSSHLGTNDLVTYDYSLFVPCYGDEKTDMIRARIINWTTSSNNYITVYTPVNSNEVGVSQRHNGYWTSNAYTISQHNDPPIAIYDNGFIVIDGLQILSSIDNRTYKSGILIGTIPPGSKINISNTILKGNVTNSVATSGGVRVSWNTGEPRTLNFWNNIVYGFSNGTQMNGVYAVQCYSGWNCYVYNNIIRDSYIGLQSLSSNVIAKNNIIQNSTYCYSGSFNSSSTNNIADTNDAPGSNPKNCTVLFANIANEDFHLSSADTCAKDSGADLSSDTYLSFTKDIDGDTRPQGIAWEIGADEYLSGVSPVCGDGNCDAGETCSSCPSDCPTGTGQVCCSGVLYTGDCCLLIDCLGGETCVNHVCTSSSSCTSEADGDGNGIISITELINYLLEWKSGSVTISELINGISEWKNGC